MKNSVIYLISKSLDGAVSRTSIVENPGRADGSSGKSFEQAPSGAVLLLTLKTGGVGLNLTKASYVFHLEPWWNPAIENQATDRVHRMGQKRAVQVYRYIMHESVEEKIEILKSKKQQRFDALFSDTEDLDPGQLAQSSGNYLTQDHFRFLLS